MYLTEKITKILFLWENAGIYQLHLLEIILDKSMSIHYELQNINARIMSYMDNYVTRITSDFIIQRQQYKVWNKCVHIDGLMHETRNCIDDALKLRLLCINPSIYHETYCSTYEVPGDGYSRGRYYDDKLQCVPVFIWWFLRSTKTPSGSANWSICILNGYLKSYYSLFMTGLYLIDSIDE